MAQDPWLSWYGQTSFSERPVLSDSKELGSDTIFVGSYGRLSGP